MTHIYTLHNSLKKNMAKGLTLMGNLRINSLLITG